MIRILRVAALAGFTSVAANAADVPASHPEYKSLLEASHSILEPDGGTFRVIRLWASDRWAFLCALALDQHQNLIRTEGNIDLYMVILKRTPTWVEAGGLVRFVEDPATASNECRFNGVDTTKALSDELLEQALRADPWNREAIGDLEQQALVEYFLGDATKALASLNKLVNLLADSARAKDTPEAVRSAYKYDELVARGRIARLYRKQGNKPQETAQTKLAVGLGRTVMRKPSWSAADLARLVEELDQSQGEYVRKEMARPQ
jgi:hypothetical protein